MLVQKTNAEILREIGARLRGYRLQQEMTAESLAERAGMSKTTLLSAEAGGNVGLETLVRILRVLGRLDAIDAFLPEPTVSPMQMLRSGTTRAPRRARSRRAAPNRPAVPGAPVLPSSGVREIVSGGAASRGGESPDAES